MKFGIPNCYCPLGEHCVNWWACTEKNDVFRGDTLRHTCGELLLCWKCFDLPISFMLSPCIFAAHWNLEASRRKSSNMCGKLVSGIYRWIRKPGRHIEMFSYFIFCLTLFVNYCNRIVFDLSIRLHGDVGWLWCDTSLLSNRFNLFLSLSLSVRLSPFSLSVSQDLRMLEVVCWQVRHGALWAKIRGQRSSPERQATSSSQR